MKISITPHPFYEPYWRRVAIVASVTIWLGVEFLVSHDGMWTAVAGGTLIYSFWAFLIDYPQAEKKD